MIKYFDKYKYILIKIDSIWSSKQIQEFLIKNDILWGGDSKNIYPDNSGYYIVGKHHNNKFISIGYQDVKSDWFKNEYTDNSNNIIYNIEKINSFKNIILHGTDKPNYKPKRIKREV